MMFIAACSSKGQLFSLSKKAVNRSSIDVWFEDDLDVVELTVVDECEEIMLRTRKLSLMAPPPFSHSSTSKRKSIAGRLPPVIINEAELFAIGVEGGRSVHRKRSYVVQHNKSTTKNNNINNVNTKLHFRRHTVQPSLFVTTSQGSTPVLPAPVKSKELLVTMLRRILRLVRTLCRVSIAIRRYAVNKNDSRILMDFQHFLKPPSTDNLPTLSKEMNRGNMYFNKHVYSIDSNHAFPIWARKMCATIPDARTPDALEKLKRYLRGHPTFMQFDEETQSQLAKNVLYHRYDRKRIILNQVNLFITGGQRRLTGISFQLILNSNSLAL